MPAKASDVVFERVILKHAGHRAGEEWPRVYKSERCLAERFIGEPLETFRQLGNDGGMKRPIRCVIQLHKVSLGSRAGFAAWIQLDDRSGGERFDCDESNALCSGRGEKLRVISARVDKIIWEHDVVQPFEFTKSAKHQTFVMCGEPDGTDFPCLLGLAQHVPICETSRSERSGVVKVDTVEVDVAVEPSRAVDVLSYEHRELPANGNQGPIPA